MPRRSSAAQWLHLGGLADYAILDWQGHSPVYSGSPLSPALDMSLAMTMTSTVWQRIEEYLAAPELPLLFRSERFCLQLRRRPQCGELMELARRSMLGHAAV